QIPLLQAGTHNINICTSNGQEIARATVDIVDRPFTAEEIYRQFLQSTVWIITLDSGGQRLGWGSGSLVHRGQKLILTNFHVIKDQRRIVACFPRYKKTTDGNELITAPQKYLDDFKKTGIKCEIVAKDSGHDLALVQLDSLPPYSPVVPLARKSPNIGANIYSVGASGVTPNRKTGVLEGTLWRLTTGQVRQVYERDDDFGSFRVTSYVVETNAAVNRGDSGGPVVNDRGQMVAVVSSGRIHDRLVSHNIDVR